MIQTTTSVAGRQWLAPAGLLLAAALLLPAPAAHAQAPLNDECPGAQALPVAAVGSPGTVVSTTNADATGSTDIDPPSCGIFYRPNDVWYTVTVPATGRVRVASSQLDAALTSVGLAFYSGSCGSLTALRCIEGYTSGGSYYPQLDIANRAPGEVLYVRAFTYGRPYGGAVQQGAFGLSATALDPCPAPADIAIGDVHPNRATVSFSALPDASSYTVRYTPAGGPAQTTVITDPSTQLTGLRVATRYTVEVAGDCGGFSAPVTFTTSAGLPNDDCAGALALAVSTTCTAPVTVATADATSSAGLADPSCGDYYGGDVWYTVTVPANGIVQVETSDVSNSSLSSSGLSVYGGACGSLTEISCDNNHSNQGFSYIRLTGRTPGEVLYVRAWAPYGPSSQPFSLCASTDDASPVTTWTGANGTDWADAGNWTAGVPEATSTAYVPIVNSGNYPVLPSATTAVHTLSIDRYAGFTATAGTLVLTGSLLCREPFAQWVAEDNSSGFFTQYTGGVRVVFSGAGPQQLAGISRLYDLQIQATGRVTLTTALEIHHELTMSGGVLSTGLTWLNLTKEDNIEFLPASTARLVHESETSYVLGRIQTQRVLDSAGQQDDFSGVGLTLATAAASPDVPYMVRLNRYTGTAPAGVGGRAGILRAYNAEPDNDAHLSLTMDLHYFAHERNGLADNNLRLYSSPGGLAGPWALEAASTRLAPAAPDSASTVRLAGLSHLSGWTLGAGPGTLPVTLTSFSVEAAGPDALLRWTTASEVNNQRFEAEVSPDGRVFGPVGQVAGQGSSSQAHAYSLRDGHVARYGAPQLYYRLRQVDADGTAAYSPVRSLAVPGLVAGATAFPNPFAQTLTVQVPAPAAGPVQLVLRDALGREVLRQTTTLPDAGPQYVAVAGAAQLPAGLYLLTVTQPGQPPVLLRVSRQ